MVSSGMAVVRWRWYEDNFSRDSRKWSLVEYDSGANPPNPLELISPRILSAFLCHSRSLDRGRFNPAIRPLVQLRPMR